MKKSDLQLFMLIEYRCGAVRIVVNDYDGSLILADVGNWEPLGSYDNNLIHRTHAELDIVKVFSRSSKQHLILNLGTTCRDLLWERKDNTKVKEMTIEQASKALGFKVKIVE